MDYRRGEHTYHDGVNEQQAQGQFNGMLYSHQASARSHSHLPYSSAGTPSAPLNQVEHQRTSHSGSMLSYSSRSQFSHFLPSPSQEGFPHHPEPAGFRHHLQHPAASLNPRPSYPSQQAMSVGPGKSFTSSPGQLPTSVNRAFNGSTGGGCPILQASVVQNQPASLQRFQQFSAPHPTHTQSKTSSQTRPLFWQPISVHQPVDAHALSQETVQASASQVASTCVPSIASPAPIRPFLGSRLGTTGAGEASRSSLSSLLNSPISRANVSANGRASAPLRSPVNPSGVNDFEMLPLSPFRTSPFQHVPTPQGKSGTVRTSTVSPSPSSGSQPPRPPSPNDGLTSPSLQIPQRSSGRPEVAPIVHPRLGHAERQIKKKTTDNGLNEAIQAFCDNQDEEIKRIASEFKTSLLNVKKRVSVHRRFRENRKSSLYNALMHKKAQEDRLAGGSMLTLKERHAAMDEDQDIQDILNDPDGEEALQAMADLKAHQQAKIMGARSSSKANDNDIMKTWGDLAQRAENLSKRTSAATFGFVCSSKAGQNVTRQFFGNGPIEGFLLSKFKMSGAEFVEAAEAYCIYTSSGRTASGMGVKSMQKEASKIIVQGLRDVTGNPKLNIEYNHYEYLIVYEYGVQLMGWPSDVEMISPHKLTAPDAIKVYQAVESRSCQWRKVDGVKLHQIKKSIDARIKSKELALPERRQQGKKRPARNQGGGRTTKKKRLATATASVDRSKKTKSTWSKKSTSNPKRRYIVHSDEEDFEIDSGNNSTDNENDSDNEDDSDSENDDDNGDRDHRDNRDSNNNGHDSGDDNDRNGDHGLEDGMDEAPKTAKKTKPRPSRSSLKSRRPGTKLTKDKHIDSGDGFSDEEVEEEEEDKGSEDEVDELDDDM
ncbi:hypothetical protein C8R42DRAFT_637086 [Lentinula raphanica]|nr:hypothetical protein C8R42DRAFT_637086 [Lentinula raphanica]